MTYVTERLERFPSVRGGDDLESLEDEEVAEDPAQVGIIVHHEYGPRLVSASWQ